MENNPIEKVLNQYKDNLYKMALEYFEFKSLAILKDGYIRKASRELHETCDINTTYSLEIVLKWVLEEGLKIYVEDIKYKLFCETLREIQ